MPKTPLHGTGALHRIIPKEEEVVGAHLAATPPDFTKSTGLQEPPNEDQGSSNSCTSQSFWYHFWQLTGLQGLRNDSYSHTFMPGGGAYLTAPADFVSQTGVLLRNQQYQEPNPETEANMEHIVLPINAAGRTKAYKVSRTLIHPDINTIGNLLEQYKGMVIGVDGNDQGWQNMTDPSFNDQIVWGHALYVYDRTVRNGQPALKAKSSWCNEIPNHYINQSYFNAGGVFEVIAITVQEISMNLVNDNGTYYIVGELGKIGIADPEALAKFQKVTSQVTTGPSGNLPQVGIFKQESQSVLVDN